MDCCYTCILKIFLIFTNWVWCNRKDFYDIVFTAYRSFDRLGVVLDGWMHPLDEKVYEDIKQPVLMINMESFQWKTNVEQMIRLLSQDEENRKMITIK